MSTSHDERDRERRGRPGGLRRAGPDRPPGEPGHRSELRSEFRSEFRSGRTLVLWITGIIGVMVVLALALAWVDGRMLEDINEYESRGLTDLPANNAGPGELLAFAAEQGLDCVSAQDLVSGAGGCNRVLEIARRINEYHSDQSLVWSFILIALIALLAAFTLFIHQASSNLRYLRSEGQRFTPGWAVGWFFIPFMNFVQPARVVRELVRASGSAETKDPRAWQNVNPQGGLLVSVWWTSVVAAILFGPRGISVFFARDSIDDWAGVGRLLVWSDLFQVVPLILTVIVVYRLQRAQEIRHQLVMSRQSRPARNS